MTDVIKCSCCDNIKPMSEYYKRNDGASHNQCKQCIQKKACDKRTQVKNLESNEKVCIACNNSKLHTQFYLVDNIVHEKCIKCCKGVEYVCKGCNTIKNAFEFYIRSDTKKPRGECKNCILIRKQKWRKDNRAHYQKQTSEYRSRPEIKAKQKQMNNAWYAKPENKERKRLRYQERYYNDPKFHIKKVMKSRMRMALKNNQKAGHTLELLGCSIDEFKKWMEYQFDPYMNWENQGSYWHMDHIKPCASFDLTKEAEQYTCFHWTNIQPMYGPENISKGETYNDRIKFCASVTLGAYEFQKIKLQKELKQLGDEYFIWGTEILHDDL